MKQLICALILLLSSSTALAAPTKTSIQLNWKPEPEFGGFYAAKEKGSFEKHGLDVDVVAGGSGTPTVQMIGAGRADFGIVSADELVIARARGNKVIALFAVYQTNPQGIMTRASRGFTKIDDLFNMPGTLAIQKGLPYATYLEKKFGFGKLQIVPAPFGDLSKYRSDEKYAMQCFVTSEPLEARKAGVEPKTFLIADAGWNPYTAVLATREDFARDHPDVITAMRAAVFEGWTEYLRDPSSTNALMQKLNPTMSAETFAAAAEAQVPLINAGDAKEAPGTMTQSRWKELVDQLVDLGVVTKEKAPAPEQCFIGSDAKGK